MYTLQYIQYRTAYIDYAHNERNAAKRAEVAVGWKHSSQRVWSAGSTRELAKELCYVREVLVDAHGHVDAVGVDEAGRAVVGRQQRREAQRDYREQQQAVVVPIPRSEESRIRVEQYTF